MKQRLVANKWDSRLMHLARHIATWSKDPSTIVGAVVVRPNNTICSTGYNGFPRGLSDADKFYEDRQIKYQRTIHAEMNAIITAPEPVTGHKLYCTLMPCSECAKLVIQSGIKTVIVPQPSAELEMRWDFKLTEELFEEAGVGLFIYEGYLP